MREKKYTRKEKKHKETRVKPQNKCICSVQLPMADSLKTDP